LSTFEQGWSSLLCPFRPGPCSNHAADPRWVWSLGPDGTRSALRTLVPRSVESDDYSPFRFDTSPGNCYRQPWIGKVSTCRGSAHTLQSCGCVIRTVVIPLCWLFRMGALIESERYGRATRATAGLGQANQKSILDPVRCYFRKLRMQCSCIRAQLQPAHGPADQLFFKGTSSLGIVCEAEPSAVFIKCILL
jgi:hypothetical protein